jgi:hypothetical protein
MFNENMYSIVEGKFLQAGERCKKEDLLIRIHLS